MKHSTHLQFLFAVSLPPKLSFLSIQLSSALFAIKTLFKMKIISMLLLCPATVSCQALNPLYWVKYPSSVSNGLTYELNYASGLGLDNVEFHISSFDAY